MELAPGLLVADRFRLVRLLGQGGMGAVWIAHHVELDVQCAVKFIEGTFANNAEFRMRFVREAHAAAQIKSPHVVHVLDSGVWNDVPYLAMELLEGKDLSHRIAEGRLPPGECVEVIGQVARALTKAHAAGFVHRDLKPDNVFLTRDDDRLLVKVLDFGIAKQLSAGPEGGTRVGTLLGTPYYMSPEQASGAKNVDARSNLWSLAVIAYECLVGAKPFDSTGLGELLLLIQAGTIPVPSQHAPWLPPSFDAWWARAVTRDPGGRFQSARELAETLATSLGVSSGVTMSAESSGSYGRASLGIGAVSAPVVTPPPGSPPIFGATPAPAAMAITAGGAGPRKSGGWVVPAVIGFVVLAGGATAWFMTRPAPSRGNGIAGHVDGPGPAVDAGAAAPPPPPPPTGPTAGTPPEPPPTGSGHERKHRRKGGAHDGMGFP